MFGQSVFIGAISATLALGLASVAEAATFSLDDRYYGSTSFTQEVDGISMTVFNPSSAPFVVDGFGMCVLGKLSDCDTSSFNISFSKKVKLVSYEVTFFTSSEPNTLGADRAVILSDGSSTSTETGTPGIGWELGRRRFANQFIVEANSIINVTAAGLAQFDYLQWNNFTVVDVTKVPEPTTILGLMTLGSLGAFAKRKLSK